MRNGFAIFGALGLVTCLVGCGGYSTTYHPSGLSIELVKPRGALMDVTCAALLDVDASAARFGGRAITAKERPKVDAFIHSFMESVQKQLRLRLVRPDEVAACHGVVLQLRVEEFAVGAAPAQVKPATGDDPIKIDAKASLPVQQVQVSGALLADRLAIAQGQLAILSMAFDRIPVRVKMILTAVGPDGAPFALLLNVEAVNAGSAAAAGTKAFAYAGEAAGAHLAAMLASLTTR